MKLAAAAKVSAFIKTGVNSGNLELQMSFLVSKEEIVAKGSKKLSRNPSQFRIRLI